MARMLAVLLCLAVLAPAPGALAVNASRPDRPAANEPRGAVDDGRDAVERKDWPGAVAHLRRATAAAPDDADAWNLLGFALRKGGDFPAALAAYDRALTLAPQHKGALEYLGEAYLQLGRPDDARAILRRLEAACSSGTCEELEDLRQAFQAHGVAQR